MDLLEQFLLEASKWSYDEFIKVWNESPDRETVAKHFNISPELASVRAQQLRSSGHELKKHIRGRKLGSTMPKAQEKMARVPSQEEFVKMWNEEPSLTAMSAKLGLPLSTVRQLVGQLRELGVDIKATSARGRPKTINIDPRSIIQIWQASDTLDEVIEKVQAMGFEIPDSKLRSYLTSFAHKVNKLRRAQGKPDLKKLQRPMYFKKPKEAGVETTPGESDVDLMDDFLKSTEQGPSPSPDEDVSLDDISLDDDPVDASSDDEFIEAWNTAASFADMMKTLRHLGWELSKDEIKEKARDLKSKGITLKRFV